VTLVLLTPIALDEGCWERVPLPDGEVFKHVYPGFGNRPRAAVTPTVASLADEVLDTYDGPLHLAGCSMGGMIALNAAVRRPDRVRSVLVACTGAAADPAVMEQRAADAEATGMDGVLEVTLARWFTAAALAEEGNPGVAYGRERLLALDPGAFADGWRAIATHDVVAALPAIGVPVTALAGSDDSASPVARSRQIADNVPGARFVEIEGPHMMCLERPQAFGEVLAAHLAWADA
jgi:pimeloyl-ACP methyl ester carboxylesterase